MEVAFLSEKSLSNQMGKVMPAVHCLPSGLFTALFATFPPPLAQQVKKSNHRHSGCWVPTPELCLWWRCGVSSPSRASPACPASFSLCSKQREAPAAEGKEAETAPQPGVHLYLTVWPYPPLNTHLTAAPPFLLILLLCIRLLMRFLMKCEGSENT